MSVFSSTVSVPSGYDTGGTYVPPAITQLFPPKECAVTVRLRTSATAVQIGAPGSGNQNWPLPANQEYVLTLAANEELVGLYNGSTSSPTPLIANVAVLVTGLPC